MLVTNFNVRQRTDADVGAKFVMEPMAGPDAKTDNYHLHIILHTEEDDITVYSINGLNILRDYRKNYGDIIAAICKINITDYMTKIYPNKENLELTMVMTKLQPGSGNTDTNTPKIIDYYKVVLDSNNNLPFDESMLHREPNKEEIIDVKMQLIDLRLEVLRSKIIRGCFSSSDVNSFNAKKLIQALLRTECDRVKVFDKTVVDYIDITEPSNKGVIRNLVLPDNLRFFDLVDFLQSHAGGIYSEGAGFYVQRYMEKMTAFVYPVYRVTKKHYDETPYRKVEIVLTSSNDMISESTTTSGTNFVKLIAYGNLNTINSTTVRELNGETGFTSIDTELLASNIPEDVSIRNLLPVSTRKPFIMEVHGGQITMKDSNLMVNRITNIEREDRIQIINSSIQHIGNLFTRSTELIKNRIVMSELFWPNALLFDIYPCMPCKIKYFVKDGIVKEVYGCILACEYNLIKTGKTEMHNEFKTHAKLFIGLDRYAEEGD